MKKIKYTILVLVFALFGCTQSDNSNTTTKDDKGKLVYFYKIGTDEKVLKDTIHPSLSGIRVNLESVRIFV